MSYHRDWAWLPHTSEPDIPPPAPPLAANGWGRYVTAEVASLRRELDQLRDVNHEDHLDYRDRLRSLERPPHNSIPEAVKTALYRIGYGVAALLAIKGATALGVSHEVALRLFGPG